MHFVLLQQRFLQLLLAEMEDAHAIISEFRLASSLGAMQGILLAGSRGCLQGNVLQRSCMTRMPMYLFLQTMIHLKLVCSIDC